MKDYEKGAIFIGIAALGFAAYQAYKTKEAADATDATDPKRNPVDAAIDLAENTIGGVTSWFHQRFDDATGYTKGKSEDVVNWLGAIPSGASYWIGEAKDFGKEATESGTKYIWGLGGNIAASGKEKLEQLTNKPFTAMGNAPEYIYNAAREVPHIATNLGNAITGIGSHLEETTKKSKGFFSWVKGKFSIGR